MNILKLAEESGLWITNYPSNEVAETVLQSFAIAYAKQAVEEFKASLVPVASRAWNELTAEYDFNIDADNAETLYILQEVEE